MRLALRWQKRISLGFGLLSAILFLGMVVILVANRSVVARAEIPVAEPLFSIATLSFLAVLLAYQRPEHRISWLVLLVAALRQVGYAHKIAEVQFARGIEPSYWLIWCGMLWPLLSAITYTLLGYILVLFPTGRLPSRRWRAANWLLGAQLILVIGLIVYLSTDLSRAFANGAMTGNEITLAPLAASGPFSIATYVRTIPEMAFVTPAAAGINFAMLLLAIASLAHRFRRGGNLERQQIKWVILSVGIWAFTLVSIILPTGIPFTVLTYVGPLPVIAIAVAILRYRLYDIDLIIRRTLVYGVLTVLLAVFYFGGVAVLQALLTSGVQESPLTIVLSTLAIVTLFAPLRTRIQNFIDRRFYRRKYDARQILAQFVVTARDEVDLDELTAELLAVVNRTMQPDRVSLWLKEE